MKYENNRFYQIYIIYLFETLNFRRKKFNLIKYCFIEEDSRSMVLSYFTVLFSNFQSFFKKNFISKRKQWPLNSFPLQTENIALKSNSCWEVFGEIHRCHICTPFLKSSPKTSITNMG